MRRILSARTPRTLDTPSLIPAGVLLLIYPKEGAHHILFTQRTSLVEHHKGEISFPGGGREPNDVNLQTTAIRETFEELGVHPQHLDVLGALDQVSTRSGFLISPFVGTMPFPYPLCPNPDEVAQVLEVPVPHLLASAHGGESQPAAGVAGHPEYLYNGHRIFGATARILSGFLALAGDALRPRGKE